MTTYIPLSKLSKEQVAVFLKEIFRTIGVNAKTLPPPNAISLWENMADDYQKVIPNNSREGIKKAIILAAQGVIDHDFKTYGGNISPVHIAELMRKYTAHVKQIKKEAKNSVPIPEKKQSTKDLLHYQKVYLNDIKEMYTGWIKGRIPFSKIMHVIVNDMTKYGFCDIVGPPSQQELNNALNNIVSMGKSNKEIAMFKTEHGDVIKIAKDSKNTAAVIQAFSHISTNNLNIDEVLKEMMDDYEASLNS